MQNLLVISLVYLASANYESADFSFLQSLTGLSKRNLSNHLGKLEENGLVKIHKSFVGKIPNTNVSLTENGSEAIVEHWKRLGELRKNTKKWKPEMETAK